MTTKANKHGLRAAAAERSNRHAQRTPLPPRKGDIDDAKEVLAAGAALVAGDGPDVKSWGKARTFADLAVACGWEGSVEPRGDAVELNATRGSETIVQAWRGGVWQYDASVYAFGDRTTRPRNASGATKLLNRTPDEAAAEMSKVAANRSFRKAEPKDLAVTLETAQKTLPFDPALATDAEIMAMVSGKSIVWFNRLSRKEEAGIVGRGRQLKMTFNESGDRVLNFCCPVTGYRSLLVTAILKVGTGRLESSKAETMKILVDA